MAPTSLANANTDLAEAKRIVLSGVGGRARVYLYGSRARGTAARTSDIDIGVMPTAPMDPAVLSEIRDALERSNILYPVDLVDLSHTDAAFREQVLAEAVEWTA